MPSQRRGIACGIAAYGLWGLMPLYFPLLEPAGALEIVAHRMVWSFAFIVLALAVWRRWSWLPRLLRKPRQLGLLALAAVAIAGNWGTYVWGVNHGHVVEVSLGYFINPLLTVLLGVLVMRERLRPLQWASVGVAAIAVGALTVEYGHPPWIAFILAGCFAAYGLLKKRADVQSADSLAVETGFQLLPALIFLLVLGARGEGTFTQLGAGHALLLASAGLVTALPLFFFGAAAIQVPLTLIGLLQYITPTMQFLIGVLIYHEAMPRARLFGFCLIWLALALLTYDGFRTRRARGLAVTAAKPAS